MQHKDAEARKNVAVLMFVEEILYLCAAKPRNNKKHIYHGQESSTYDPRRMGRGKTG